MMLLRYRYLLHFPGSLNKNEMYIKSYVLFFELVLHLKLSQNFSDFEPIVNVSVVTTNRLLFFGWIVLNGHTI